MAVSRKITLTLKLPIAPFLMNHLRLFKKKQKPKKLEQIYRLY